MTGEVWEIQKFHLNKLWYIFDMWKYKRLVTPTQSHRWISWQSLSFSLDVSCLNCYGPTQSMVDHNWLNVCTTPSIWLSFSINTAPLSFWMLDTANFLILSFKYKVTTDSCSKCVSFQLRAIHMSQRTPFARFCCGANHGAIWWINKNQWCLFWNFFSTCFKKILVKIQFVIFCISKICQAYCMLNRTNMVVVKLLSEYSFPNYIKRTEDGRE